MTTVFSDKNVRHWTPKYGKRQHSGRQGRHLEAPRVWVLILPPNSCDDEAIQPTSLVIIMMKRLSRNARKRPNTYQISLSSFYTFPWQDYFKKPQGDVIINSKEADAGVYIASRLLETSCLLTSCHLENLPFLPPLSAAPDFESQVRKETLRWRPLLTALRCSAQEC